MPSATTRPARPRGASSASTPTRPATRRLPSVAMDSAGDFVIAWHSYGEDGSGYGIYAQRYNVDRRGPGERVPGQYVHDRQPGPSPSVAMDAAGDFVVTW